MAGAECLERHDLEHRGKPFALSWALDRLGDRLSEFDTCVILDADSVVEPGYALAVARARNEAPVVQTYFGVQNPGESWLTLLGDVLARVRYEYLYPLKARAGLSVPLTGNGMCVATDILVRDGWTAFGLTENWELYARFVAQGVRIGYAGNARLRSQEAASLSGGTTQRERWLAGRMLVAREWLLPLLETSRATRHQKLDALSEIVGLSPVLQGVGALMVSVSSVMLVPAPAGWILCGFGLISLTWIAVPSILVLSSHPKRLEIIGAFALLPIYSVWRLAVAVRSMVRGRTLGWRKTQR